jgi:hypothetical protein
MRKFTVLVISVFILIAVFDTHASNKESGITLLIMPSTEELSRSQRTEIAEDLLQKIKAIDSYIPSLTPDESQWLDQEWKSLSSLSGAASSQKLVAIENSPQFQTREIKNRLKNIRLALECVTSKRVVLTREMFCWAYASRGLIDQDYFNFAIRVLNKSGKAKFSSKVKEQLGLIDIGDGEAWRIYNLYGKEI